MPVTFKCPNCGRELLAHDELGVTQRRCSGCGTMADVPGGQRDVVARHAEQGSFDPIAAIQGGHLDKLVEYLGERYHGAHQRKIEGGRRWSVFLMTPAEVADFFRLHERLFHAHQQTASDAGRVATAVQLFPRGRSRGCLRLTGLALPNTASGTIAAHPSLSAHGLRTETCPMDGRPVQVNFVGEADHDAVRPSEVPELNADALEEQLRNRIYTLGWDKRDVELLYHGVRLEALGLGATAEEARQHPLIRRMKPSQLVLMQRLFECETGARQISEAQGALEAVLAVPSGARVLAEPLVRLLVRVNDAELCAVFHGLDMSHIPMNDNCPAYFQKAESFDTRLTGPDPRLVTLTFALAAVAEAKREAPAAVLAQKLIPKFREKIHHGQISDAVHEWHIGRWAQTYYTAAALILARRNVGQYDWALPILDAVVMEYPTAQEPLYWRGVAAYDYWRVERTNMERAHVAHQCIADYITAARNNPADPDHLHRAREMRARIVATEGE